MLSGEAIHSRKRANSLLETAAYAKMTGERDRAAFVIISGQDKLKMTIKVELSPDIEAWLVAWLMCVSRTDPQRLSRTDRGRHSRRVAVGLHAER